MKPQALPGWQEDEEMKNDMPKNIWVSNDDETVMHHNKRLDPEKWTQYTKTTVMNDKLAGSRGVHKTMQTKIDKLTAKIEAAEKIISDLEKLGTAWQSQGVMGSQMFIIGSAVARPCREYLAQFKPTPSKEIEDEVRS